MKKSEWIQTPSLAPAASRSAELVPGMPDDQWQSADTPVVIVDRSTPEITDRVLTDGEWVSGTGDPVDYRIFRPEAPGEYEFTLNDVDRLPVRLTVSSIVYDRNGVPTSLKTIKSITVTPRWDRKNNTWTGISGTTGALRLTGGADYVVKVEAVKTTQSDPIGYELRLNGKVFTRANQQADDTWETAGDAIVIGREQATVETALITDEWVGFGDKTDYRKVVIESAGQYVFHLTGLEEAAAKLTVFSAAYDTRTGDEKKPKTLKSITVTPKLDKKTGQWSRQEGATAPLLLQAGVYYIAVDAPGAASAKNTAYEVALTGTAFIRGNATDDTWETAGDAIVIGREQATVETALITDEWVGFGDKTDYRKVVIEGAGEYVFQLTGLEEAAAKLTVFSAAYDTRTGDEKKPKTLKSITVTPKLDKKTGQWSRQEGATAPLLLQAGVYYIAVDAPGAASAKNTAYEVALTGNVFINARPEDDDWTTANAFRLTDGITGEWVGFGDAIDYYAFTLKGDEAGLYDFALTADPGEAVLTVYRKNFDRSGNEIKPVALKSVSVGKDGTGRISGLQLLAGDYYLSIRSADSGKGKKNTDYQLQAGQSVAYQAVALTEDAAGVSGGFSVTLASRRTEYRAFTLRETGTINIHQEGGGKLTLYRNVNNKLQAVSLMTNLLLEAGTYYLKATNSGKTELSLDVRLEHEFLPEPNFPLEAPAEVEIPLPDGNGPSLFSGGDWVGYGDGADYYRFTTGDTGFHGLFGFAATEAPAQPLKLSVGTIVNGKFKTAGSRTFKPADVISETASRNRFQVNLAANTTYYLKIETTDGGKGKYNTDYRFVAAAYAYSVNNSFEDADQLEAGSTPVSVRAAVGSGDKLDYYRFSADGVYDFGIADATAGVKITLYDEAFRVVATRTHSGPRAKEDAGMFLNQYLQGTYYLKVQATAALSDYQLTLRQTGTAEALPAETGEADFTNLWEGKGDIRYYTVSGGSDGALLELSCSAGKYTIGRMDRGTFKTVATKNYSTATAAAGKANFTVELLPDTDYVLKVECPSDATPDFHFQAARTAFDLGNNTWEQAAPLTELPGGGSGIRAATGAGDRMDFYRLDDGDYERMTLNATGGGVKLTFLDADGTALGPALVCRNGAPLETVLSGQEQFARIERLSGSSSYDFAVWEKEAPGFSELVHHLALEAAVAGTAAETAFPEIPEDPFLKNALPAG